MISFVERIRRAAEEQALRHADPLRKPHIEPRDQPETKEAQMNQWVKCTFRQVPSYGGETVGYVNLATVRQMYRLSQATELILAPDSGQQTIIWVRETPEQLLAQLVEAPVPSASSAVAARAAPN